MAVPADPAPELQQYSNPTLLVTTEWLAEHRSRVAAEVHHGGQPLYPYLFSIE